jgi:hypothetical protein
MAADRFVSLSDEELQALFEDRDSSNTKNVIGAAKIILLEYYGVKHIDVDELLTKLKKEICCLSDHILRRRLNIALTSQRVINCIITTTIIPIFNTTFLFKM